MILKFLWEPMNKGNLNKEVTSLYSVSVQTKLSKLLIFNDIFSQISSTAVSSLLSLHSCYWENKSAFDIGSLIKSREILEKSLK